MKNLPNLHNDYDRFASLPKKNEGVAVYAKKSLHFKPVYASQWTSNYMMVKSGKLAIVTVYMSENWRESISNEVSRIIRQLEEESLDVILTGDFNLPIADMKKFNQRRL